MTEINGWLDRGASIIMNFNGYNPTFTPDSGGHYVCCYGRDGNEYYFSDSRLSGVNLDVG